MLCEYTSSCLLCQHCPVPLPPPLSPNFNLRLQRITERYRLTPSVTTQNVSQSLYKSARFARSGSPATQGTIAIPKRKLPLHQLAQDALRRPATAHPHPPNHTPRKHNNTPTHILSCISAFPHSVPTITITNAQSPTPLSDPRHNRARTYRSMDALQHNLLT